MTQQTILGRVSQLVRANLNDIIDRAEDPEKMVDQLVRDFTNAIDEATNAVAVSIGNLRMEEADRDSAVRVAAEWGAKGKAASRRADEAADSTEAERLNNLAREALRNQVSFEKQATTLTAKVDADTAVVDGLKDGLNKMQSRLSDLKSKRQELISRSKMVKAQVSVQTAVAAISASDPTSDLSRFEDRIRQQEAQVLGRNELAASSLDSQFEALGDAEAEDEVETRLNALKQKTPA